MNAPAAQLKILIVDDDPSVLALLEQFLKRSGYIALTATTGSEAMEMLRSEIQPDLLLLDIMLPDISGHEVCARVRADRNIRPIPIVMMTAHGDRDTLVRCLDNGADDFVRKPIDLNELRARLRAQSRSLEFRRFYRDFFESFPGALFIVTSDGRIVSANHAAADLLGIPDGELPERPMMETVMEEHRGVLLQAFSVAPDSRTPVIIPEICFVSPASGIRSCELQIQSIAFGASRLLVSATDRTHRRYLETELYKTRDFLESVIQSSVDGIIAVNRKGTIVVFNEGAEKITGYTAEEVIGRMHISKLYTEGGERDVMEKLRSTEFGGPGKLETSSYFIIGKAGEEIPVNLSASLLQDLNGQSIGSVGIFQDLRERIRIEQELTLARQRLLESEREQAMEELAGATAHELNQPLTTINGFAHLLLERPGLDPQTRQIIEKMAVESDRMAKTIKQIAKSTRFETKKYLNGTRIVDLGRSSAGKDADTEGSGEDPDDG